MNDTFTKYFHLVIVEREPEFENRKIAYYMKVSSMDNLCKILRSETIISANICESKKQAEEVVEHFNKCFADNT